MVNVKKLLTVLGMLAFSICMFPTLAMAQDPNSLSTALPDISSWVPTVATAVGGLIAAVLGVYFAIKIVMVGMTWIRRFAK